MSDPIYISEYDSIIREVLASDGEFRLYPHGVSMLPLIRQGKDSVVLQRLTRPAKAGDILFYQRRDGSYVLHRVKKVSPEGLTMWGDHQLVLEHGVTEDQIIGYAARIFRGENEINCRSLCYRVYLRLWQFMAFRGVFLWIAYILRKED